MSKAKIYIFAKNKQKKRKGIHSKNKSRTKGGPKTSIDEELLYFANMLYATSKDDTKRVNSIVDGIHKLKQIDKK